MPRQRETSYRRASASWSARGAGNALALVAAAWAAWAHTSSAEVGAPIYTVLSGPSSLIGSYARDLEASDLRFVKRGADEDHVAEVLHRPVRSLSAGDADGDGADELVVLSDDWLSASADRSSCRPSSRPSTSLGSGPSTLLANGKKPMQANVAAMRKPDVGPDPLARWLVDRTPTYRTLRKRSFFFLCPPGPYS